MKYSLFGVMFALASLPACEGDLVRIGPTPGTGYPTTPGVTTPGQTTPGSNQTYPSTPGAGAAGYAHTASTLYRVAFGSMSVSVVSSFTWPAGPDYRMGDIAVNQRGEMFGMAWIYDDELEEVVRRSLFRIDPNTARTTRINDLEVSLNGLTFVDGFAGGEQRLVGSNTEGGQLYEVDVHSGRLTLIGSYGDALESSGDLTTIADFGTIATVMYEDADGEQVGTDWLARIDARTGQASLIGETGFTKIWGIGHWGGKVYGFTGEKLIVEIDPRTGRGTIASSGEKAWWGAASVTLPTAH